MVTTGKHFLSGDMQYSLHLYLHKHSQWIKSFSFLHLYEVINLNEVKR